MQVDLDMIQNVVMTAAFFGGFGWVFSTLFASKPSKKEWEGGRRELRKPHIKDRAYYAKHGVRTIEEYFENSRGVEIFMKRWLPLRGDVKGVVFYCHGYGDTCAYLFDDVAVVLASTGYAVFGMDYEGHGQSSGLHGYIRNFDIIVDDVIEAYTWVKGEESFAGKPYFLYGESMGGAVALKIHRKEPRLWDGAILLAPMCKISDDMYPPWIIVQALIFLARLFPTWRLVPTRDVCAQSFKVPEKRTLAYNNPTAYEGKPRLGTAVELLRTTDDIAAHLSEVSLPFLLLHGAADTVTDPSVSKALFEQAASKDKSMLVYEGCWHALTGGEPDDIVKRVTGDIISWLDARSQNREQSDLSQEHSLACNGVGEEVSSQKNDPSTVRQRGTSNGDRKYATPEGIII